MNKRRLIVFVIASLFCSFQDAFAQLNCGATCSQQGCLVLRIPGRPTPTTLMLTCATPTRTIFANTGGTEQAYGETDVVPFPYIVLDPHTRTAVETSRNNIFSVNSYGATQNSLSCTWWARPTDGVFGIGGAGSTASGYCTISGSTTQLVYQQVPPGHHPGCHRLCNPSQKAKRTSLR
jgi:hypothetical protein